MQDFIYLMTQGRLNDVIVMGFIDSNVGNLLVFYPMYDRLFFIFEEIIYEISLDDDGFIQVNPINKISIWFDIDEDDQLSQMSIYS